MDLNPHSCYCLGILRNFVVVLLFQLLSSTILSQNINISADTTICLGGTASVSGILTTGGYGTDSYTFQIIPYNPMPFSGGTPVDQSIPNSNCSSLAYGGKDDCWAGPFDIGFTFCFFNQEYTQFYIGTNGWVSFSPSPSGNAWTTFTAWKIPTTRNTVPKNCIFFPWEDWLPGMNGGNNIYYYQSGTAPDRVLVVYWLNCPHFSCQDPAHQATFQVVLHEQSSIIENNIQKKVICGNYVATQGVHRLDGLVAFTATGRDSTIWSATNESTRFVPSGTTWYTGGYPTGTIVGYGGTLTVAPVVTTRYTCVINSCGSGTDTASVLVTVLNPNFNYNSPSYCKNQLNPMPVVPQPGGTFSASPAGLVFISTLSGRIDLAASIPGSYTVTYTRSSGSAVCQSNQSVTIYDNPPAPVAAPATVSRCGPGSVTLHVTVGSHQTAKWYNAPTGGTIYPFTGTTVTTNIIDTTYFYAETYDSISTCTSTTRTLVTAIMKPIPAITNTILSDTICSGFPNDFVVTTDLSSTSISWIASCTTGTVTGFTPVGNGNHIHDTLTNQLATNGVVTYSVTPQKNGCAGSSVNFFSMVKPKPVIVPIPAGDTICSGQSFTINLTSTVPGTMFSWTATGGSPFVTGYSGGAGTSINQTIMNSDILPHNVTYTITGTVNGCNSGPVQVVIRVNPRPVLTVAPPSQQICNNTPTSLSLSSTVTGSNNSWTASASSPNLSGYSAGSGSTIVQTLTNSGLTVETVTYKIVATVNGCHSDTVNAQVTVNPVPDVYFSPATQTICSGQNTNINLLSHVSGTAFSWTASPGSANITGYAPGTGNHIGQKLDINGYLPDHVIYTVTPKINLCPGILGDFTENVNPVANVQFNVCNDTLTTTNAKAFTLKGGLPLGGTYSGPGVNAGIFTPSLAGTGSKAILYSYTNLYSCTSSASRHIIVSAPAALTCGNDMTDIRDNKSYPTVLIGSQCWMASNLNYGTMIPGSTHQRDNCIPEKYCYNDLTANCQLGTANYQWDELMQYSTTAGIQGLCPPGWHIPDETEWNTLFNNYISNGFAGSPLKSTGYSGFDALLSGIRFMNKTWKFDGWATFFWSSTAHSISKAWAHAMNDPDPSVSFYPALRSNAFSVRCLKD